MTFYRIVATYNGRDQIMSEWLISKSEAGSILADTHPALRAVIRKEQRF